MATLFPLFVGVFFFYYDDDDDDDDDECDDSNDPVNLFPQLMITMMMTRNNKSGSKTLQCSNIWLCTKIPAKRVACGV